jgi:hypothetical protein
MIAGVQGLDLSVVGSLFSRLDARHYRNPGNGSISKITRPSELLANFYLVKRPSTCANGGQSRSSTSARPISPKTNLGSEGAQTSRRLSSNAMNARN